MPVADNTLVFQTSSGEFQPGDFHVHHVDGYEALSTPYEYHVVVQCNVEGGISPDGADSLLSSSSGIAFGPGGIRSVTGVIREIEQLEMTVDARISSYRLVLVPRLWRANFVRLSRAFNEMSIPDILKAVLKELGFAEGTDFELKLDGTYNALEYVVQYEETNFAFMNRWMERLGMFYWFEQGEDKEKLVIADANSAFPTATDHGESAYSDHMEEFGPGSIHRLRRTHRAVPAKQVVRDHNWRTPAKPIQGVADVDTAHGFGLMVNFGDHFKDGGQGTDFATKRAEGFLAGKEVYTASTGSYDFSAGYRFTLSGAPVGDLDQEYVMTRVVHRMAQDSAAAGMGSYTNEIQAIPFATQYRAPRVTPWPRIDGVTPAVIDAESISSASPIDSQGRYRVVTPWDVYGKYGGKASRWVRKAEPYAGTAYGTHMTLHAGTEVLLAHLGGDPDRPIIIGAVPNPTMGTPITASHATLSGTRTRSGMTMTFEDDA